MTRRAALALLLSCAACTKREAPIDPFPETLAGWKRTSIRDLPPAEFSEQLPKANVRRAQVAGYEGQGKTEVRAYELSRQEIGLDIAQRWRPEADSVFFWARSYFVVVTWKDADRKALQEFTRALEKRLNAP